ncbi:DUF2207 domain-containing protein, partial [Gemmatimonadota bacterium]
MTYRRPLLAGILAAAFVAVVPGALAAQRTLTIESFDAELRVEPDGNVHVTETIRPRFQGSWNGIYRNLSLEHQTAEGRRERLDIDLTSITDEAGSPLRYEASNEGRWTRRFQVWVPGAQDATRTVVIRYVVHNAIRFFDRESEVGPLDELYWNVTGNEWEVPIERAAARIVLPGSVVPTQSAGYTGIAGSTETAVRVETLGASVAFVATRGLDPGEGLTVTTGWPPGRVARPTPVSGLSRGIGFFWPLLLPFLAFGAAFRQWRRKGRDPEARAIAVQYEPPANLGPAEVGTLVDHKAEMHDITATLVDLAVRGFIHIQKIKTKTLGILSSTEYVFHLKKPEEEWAGLSTHEERYLKAVFKRPGSESSVGVWKALLDGAEPDPDVTSAGAGDGPTYGSVELSSLKNQFYKDLKDIRKALYDQLIAKGHYDRDPSAAQAVWSVGGAVVLVASIAGAFWMSDSGVYVVDPLVLAIGGGLCGIVLLIFGQLMPARTLQGARAREWALGFKEFLERVEEDRFRRMITSPEMFERFLAYAMAFKVESEWAKAFEDMYTEPPQWYSGPSGHSFHASSFTQDLSAMSTAASSTMSSSPSGSGGGGSSGGGSDV